MSLTYAGRGVLADPVGLLRVGGDDHATHRLLPGSGLQLDMGWREGRQLHARDVRVQGSRHRALVLEVHRSGFHGGKYRHDVYGSVKASNFGRHGTFEPFLASSVASWDEICNKNEQNRIWKSKVFFDNVHFLHLFVGSVLTIWSPSGKKNLKFTWGPNCKAKGFDGYCVVKSKFAWFWSAVHDFHSTFDFFFSVNQVHFRLLLRKLRPGDLRDVRVPGLGRGVGFADGVFVDDFHSRIRSLLHFPAEGLHRTRGKQAEHFFLYCLNQSKCSTNLQSHARNAWNCEIRTLVW